jgi:epoxyqueuosine reductase QueG
VDLIAWLDPGPGDGRLDEDLLQRLYVPRNDPRWLRRNALVALGNEGTATPETVAVVRHAAGGDDELLAEHARWALERLERRCS